MDFTYHNNFLRTFKLFGKINPEQYTLPLEFIVTNKFIKSEKRN